MGQPDGAHTHHGGGGDWALVAGAVVLALAVAGRVAGLVADLVAMLMILIPVVVGLAVAGAAVALVWHLRRPLLPPRPVVLPPGTRLPVAEQPRPALPPVQVHHHWHGVTPEDVARRAITKETP